MEAASRPELELLPDLPVEAPTDATKAATGLNPAPVAPVAAEAAAKTAADGTPPKDSDPTGLNFVDPEMFLAAGETASAIPVLNASAVSDSKLPEPAAELELEDPVVDEMLTSPPPPAPPAPTTAPAAAAPVAAAAPSPAEQAALREAARVPIAKTASLSAAATKLAAAQRSPGKSGTPKPKITPTASAKPGSAAGPTPARTAKDVAPAAPPNTNTAKGTSSATPSPASGSKAAPSAAPSTAATPKLDAPSLASWASARDAAASAAKAAAVSSASATRAPTPKTGTSASGTYSSASPASARPVTAPASAAAHTAAHAAAPATAPAPAPAPSNALPPAATMDRDYIARNQVVERYLSGRLPIKGATEFERFCKEHPKFLDDIGLAERVNAGLRLLEASGKPEPWQETKTPAWQKPAVTLGLAVGVVILGMALGVVSGANASKSHRIDQLQHQASERALDPATSTREIRLMPSRSGASNSPAITIGGGGVTQLADFKIDESRSPYHVFRITIDRIDQGRVGVINNMAKDSNGHLRIALNSSALGPGNYLLTLEGLDWRGEPQPDSWVTIGIAR